MDLHIYLCVLDGSFMSDEPNLNEIKKEYHGTLRSYIQGFIVALLLTLASFALVITKLISGRYLIYTIIALGLIQAAVQLRFFLKLGHEDHPRWETLVFGFMFFVLLIIAIGSLWIMKNLNDRLM